MCLYWCKITFLFLILNGILIKQIQVNGGHLHHKVKHGRKSSQSSARDSHEVGKRTNVASNGAELAAKPANYRRSMKSVNATEEKNSALLTRRAEDIFMDEIKGSDQAANRAEISYDIPKQMEFLKASMKAGDITDLDTENMIDLNEKKGTYLPVSEVAGSVRGSPTKKLLTEQFKNISGLPDFMMKDKSKLGKGKHVSLVERVADSLQPSASAISGIKQLLEENKVEQSLKKHLDAMNSKMISDISNPPMMNMPSVIDTNSRAESLSAVDMASQLPLNPAYITPISSDQIYDESISPPEQLLDELSTGKFKRPLSENALDKMSDWNPNREYLADNGFFSQDIGEIAPKLSRVSSEILPVHDVYLHQKPMRPTGAITRDSLELLKNDPEVLGRNQELLNSKQFHSLSDLDTIGPPIYPARVVHLPHRPKHVHLPPKRIVTHLKGIDLHQDEDEGVLWHQEDPEDAMDNDEEHFYHPHRPGK